MEKHNDRLSKNQARFDLRYIKITISSVYFRLSVEKLTKV